MMSRTLSTKHILLASALIATPILLSPSTSSALSFDSIHHQGVTATIENGIPIRFERFRNAVIFVDTNNNILFPCISSSKEDITFSVALVQGKNPDKPFWIVRTISKEKEPRVIDYWLVGTDSKGEWANFISNQSLQNMNVSLDIPKGSFGEEIVDGTLHITHLTNNKPDTSFYAQWDDAADWIALASTIDQLPTKSKSSQDQVSDKSDSDVVKDALSDPEVNETLKGGVVNNVLKANVMMLEQVWGFFSGLFIRHPAST